MTQSLTGTWLLDTNILVAFFDATSAHHTAAITVITQLENGSFQGIIAAQNILELSSILISGYKVIKENVAIDIQTLVSLQNISMIYPNAATIDRYLKLLNHRNSVHTTDLLLAATMLTHGISSIITNDRDFEKLSELTVYNPFLTSPLK